MPRKVTKTPFYISSLTLSIFTLLIFYGLGATIIPLLVAGLLAFMLFPIVEDLNSLGIQRESAVLMTFFGLIAVILVAFFIAIPKLGNEITAFLSSLPEISTSAISKIEKLAMQLGLPIEWNKDQIHSIASHIYQTTSLPIAKGLTGFLTQLVRNVYTLLLFVMNLYRVPL